MFDATVVRIDTDRPGLYGVGENTPLGPSYLPAYPQGTRAGIAVLAPLLIGRYLLDWVLFIKCEEKPA